MSKMRSVAPTTALQVSFMLNITKTELNIISLGQGNQMSIKSWYMPPHMYEKSNQWPGRWSSHTESLFNLLDQTFRDGKPSITRGPHTRKAWDDQARSSLDIRKARMRLETAAAKLF